MLVTAQWKSDEIVGQVPAGFTVSTGAGLDEDDKKALTASYEAISALPEDNISNSSDASEDDIETHDTALIRTAVEENISDLLRFASLIRQQSTSRTLQGGETYDPSSSDDESSDESDYSDNGSGGQNVLEIHKNHVPLSSRFQTHAEYVLMRELGPQRFDEPESKLLKDRLLRTMMTRWRRVCYRNARGKRFAKMMAEAKEDQPPLVETHALQLQTYFSPAAKIENLKVTTETLSKPRSSLGGATTLASEFSLSGQRQLKSNTQKSASRTGGHDLTLPTIPKVEYVRDGYLYNCSYCGVLPTTKKPLDRYTWK